MRERELLPGFPLRGAMPSCTPRLGRHSMHGRAVRGCSQTSTYTTYTPYMENFASSQLGRVGDRFVTSQEAAAQLEIRGGHPGG